MKAAKNILLRERGFTENYLPEIKVETAVPPTQVPSAAAHSLHSFQRVRCPQRAADFIQFF